MSERIKKAGRRHAVQMIAAALLYCGSLFVCLLLARGLEPGPALTALAIIPVLPMFYAAYAFFQFYRDMDEMQKRISANAAALAMVVGVLTAIALGILKRFGVLDFEDDMMLFGPFLIIVWGAMRYFLGGRDC